MIGYTVGEADAYSNIALIYKIKENTLKSNLYYTKAKESLETVVKKNSAFTDKLKLCEIYINLNEFDKANDILKDMSSVIDDNHHFKFLISCYKSLVLFLTGYSDGAIALIQEVIQNESILNKKYSWNFTDILLTIKDKLEPSQSIIISDLIYFMQNKTRFPLIRFGHVKIINGEVSIYSEVFHPFIGLRTITKDDISFKSIISKLMEENIIINTDVEEIMGVERNTALIVLGYLYNKNYIEVRELSTTMLKVGLSVNAMSKLKNFRTEVR
jgi:tetratricopeptide (TPR) repeat protein